MQKVFPAKSSITALKTHVFYHAFDYLPTLDLKSLAGARYRWQVNFAQLRHFYALKVWVIQLLQHVDWHEPGIDIDHVLSAQSSFLD